VPENNIANLRIAILATEGFEQPELVDTRKALDQAGAKTQVISPMKGKIRAWNRTDWGEDVAVDVPLEEAKPGDYDALLLPGGVINPDKLRMVPKAVEFVKSFFTQSKPVAAICHGPVMLVEADVLRGRTVTSWPSIKTDVRNAGANWVDQEAVVDNGLVTSRKPDDIPAFNRRMIEVFSQRGGAQGGRRVA
jgi:protease I